MRRKQVIEEAHRLSPGNPDYGSAEKMMGPGERAGAVVISSALISHTASCLRGDAAILTEQRKAQEEQRLRAQPNKSRIDRQVRGELLELARVCSR